MKKILKVISVLSLTAAVAGSASLSASAAGINAAEQRILDELHTTVTMQGYEKYLPVRYINQTENYLNTVDLTEAEADKIIEGINITKAYLTSTGAPNYDGLTDEEIDIFFSKCQDTVRVIDLTIAYDKATRVVTIIDKGGKVIYSGDQDKKGGIDSNPIKTTGAGFNTTGAVAAAGIGVLSVSAAGVYLFSKKKKVECEDA